MKYTPSPFVSYTSSSCSTPTTTTTTTTCSINFESFSATKSSLFGCIPFLLSKFLWSPSPPTYPSEQFEKENIASFEDFTAAELMKTEKYLDGFATPGIVARLMGLDSVPDINYVDTHKARSKSMGSTEFRVEGEAGDKQNKDRRRARCSISFKERRGFFELEDDDFLVLSFDNVGAAKDKSRPRKNGKPNMKECFEDEEHGTVAGRRTRRVEKENYRALMSSQEQGKRPSLKISDSDSVVFKENSVGVKRRDRKKKKTKKRPNYLLDVKLEIISELENSSPVSVLDHSEFGSDHEVSGSAEEDTINKHSSSRRKFSSVLERKPSRDCKCPDERSQEANAAAYEIETKTKQVWLLRKDYHRQQNVGMLIQICKLAELDVVEISNDWSYCGRTWRNPRRAQEDDHFGVELGLQIVDQLIDELVVDQLDPIKS